MHPEIWLNRITTISAAKYKKPRQASMFWHIAVSTSKGTKQNMTKEIFSEHFEMVF